MTGRKRARRHSYTRNGRTYYRGGGTVGYRRSAGKRGGSSYQVQGVGPMLAVGAIRFSRWSLSRLFKLAVKGWDWLTSTDEPYRMPARAQPSRKPPPAPAAPATRYAWQAPGTRRPVGLCTAHGSGFVPGCRGCERAAGR